MTPRTVSILLFMTIVSVAAAAYGVSTRVDFQSSNFQGQRLFPGLLNNAGNVKELIALQHGKTMTLVQHENGWGLKESGGYPVHANLVNKVIFGLSNMELLDPKTSEPSRLVDLNLDDPTQKKSGAQRVTLKDAGGSVMADLVVGRANFFLPETTTGGMYVRRPDENQTWLVRGLVDIGVDPRDWLQRDIIDIEPERIQRAEVTHPDGEVLNVVPMKGVTGDFAFENMPDGVKLKSEFAPRNIAAVLKGFVLNNVRQLEDVTLDPKAAYVAEFFTVDAIQVTTHMWQLDGLKYMIIKAAYIGADPASEAAKQVRAINERTQGWAYIIPDYQFEQIAKKMAEVTEKIKPDS